MTATEVTTEIPAAKPDTLVVTRRVWKRERKHSSKPKTRQPLTPQTVTTLVILLTLGALALWFVAYALLFSSIQQVASQRQLYAEFREDLALITAPVGGAIEPGTPVAMMQAPTLGLANEIVVEGTASGQTRVGPGHLRNTPLPGQAGASVLFGRGVTFGAPFADLGSQVAGDQIVITTGQGEFAYEIDGVRRSGDPVPPPLAADEGRLILVSTESGGMLQGLAARSTVFVDATLVGKTVATPAGRPTAVAPNELLTAGSRAALIPLVLWLQALLLAVIGLVWAKVRWGTWQVWVVGVPIVIALLWGTTSTVFVLLPNVL